MPLRKDELCLQVQSEKKSLWEEQFFVIERIQVTDKTKPH